MRWRGERCGDVEHRPPERASAGVERSSGDEKASVMMKESMRPDRGVPRSDDRERRTGDEVPERFQFPVRQRFGGGKRGGGGEEKT